MRRLFGAAILIWSLFSVAAAAQPVASGARVYHDSRGHAVRFPMGDISFADEAVSFVAGKPPPSKRDSRPETALGAPDFEGGDTTGTYVTLGCGGTLVLRFTDNALVDVDGADLYVFEIGPAAEATDLSISVDGKQWLRVGKISGGTVEVDITGASTVGELFHYVKLTDLKSGCGGEWPGADIDAIGAIGSGLTFRLSGKVLFEFGKSDLKPEALDTLRNLGGRVAEYAGARLVIAGHTDSIGSDKDNQDLSERRARSVSNFLASLEPLRGTRMDVRGFGESRPVASNDSDEGRSRNRRVEITVIPSRANTAGGPAEQPTGPAGAWQTSQGALTLRPIAEVHFEGSYNPADEGRLILDRDGARLTGYWIEKVSSQRCETARDGSDYWGRVELRFDRRYTSFTGWWSYCDSSARAEAWTGTRR